MATVTFDNASRVYPGQERPAVDNLNIEVGDSEFLVLVGPSGSGKSTALRMLAGLEEIDAGRILIGDRDVTDVPPKDRDIAMVFQNYALYPHMTVADNMGFALKIAGTPKAEIRKRVEDAAAILDLSEYLDRKPKALSGGQRQRVAMGRAIVRSPQVFLMDEPLSNLDAKLRVATRTQIASLQRRLGVTTVYVTHDQTEAMTMGDRVAVLDRGVLQQIDSPRRMYDHPNNVFVAGFIGSPQMNFFDGQLSKKDGKYQIQVGEAAIVLADEAQERLSQRGAGDQAVVVGIRPEHISFATELGSHTIASKVDVSEMMGSEVYLHVNAVGRDVVLRIPTVELPAEHRSGIPYGTDIHFTFRPELVHLFDPQTEKNLMY